MIRYGCPNCRKRAFDAAGVIPVLVEWPCKSSTCKGAIVEVVPLHLPETNTVPAHRTLVCTNCDRTHHVERPLNERSYCVYCGTTTLMIVAEVGAVEIPRRRAARPERPAEARQSARTQ